MQVGEGFSKSCGPQASAFGGLDGVHTQQALVQAFVCTEGTSHDATHAASSKGGSSRNGIGSKRYSGSSGTATWGKRQDQGGDSDLDSAMIGEGQATPAHSSGEASMATQQQQQQQQEASQGLLQGHSVHPSPLTISPLPLQPHSPATTKAASSDASDPHSAAEPPPLTPTPTTPKRSHTLTTNRHLELLQHQPHTPSHQHHHERQRSSTSRAVASSTFSVPASLAASPQPQQPQKQQQQQQQPQQVAGCAKFYNVSQVQRSSGSSSSSKPKRRSSLTFAPPATEDGEDEAQYHSLVVPSSTATNAAKKSASPVTAHSVASIPKSRSQAPRNSRYSGSSSSSSSKPSNAAVPSPTTRTRSTVGPSGRSLVHEKSSRAGLEYPKLARTTLDLQALLRQLNEGHLTPADFLTRLAVIKE